MAEIIVRDLLAWEPRLSLDIDTEHESIDQPEIDLEREVTWTVTVRAFAPVLPPLRGGELVILPARAIEDPEVPLPDLFREIVARGATGVVIEQPLETPEELVRLKLDPIPIDLESDINRLLTERRGAMYRSASELERLLQQEQMSGADVEHVLTMASTYLGMNVAVLDSSAEPIASAAPLNGHFPKERTVTEMHSWRGDYYVLRLPNTGTLWLGPVPNEQHALVRLIADRLATVIEGALAHAIEIRPRGNARAIALAGLFTDSPGDASRGAISLGLPPGGTYRVALSPESSDRLATRRDLANYGSVHTASVLGTLGAALIEVRGSPPAREPEQRTRSKTWEQHPQPASEHWVALSGPVTGADRIPEAARQAQFVAALIEQGSIGGGLVRFDRTADIGVYQLLYPLWGSDELQSFVDDALGKLIAADHREILRKTLLAYLETGGLQIEAANRLGIHRNTLAYRLKQIGALIGAESIDPDRYLTLHMALLVSMLPLASPPVGAGFTGESSTLPR